MECRKVKKKKKKKGKISPFISPRKIKSRPLDYVQYGSTASGSETRSIVGIKSLFQKFKSTVAIWVRQNVAP